MRHEEFRIGEIFWCGERKWRCTDMGTRTIIAICLDHVEVASATGGPVRIIGGAEAEGWFNGPPYAVLEHVFDEEDIADCSTEPELP
jgi:hypothetical protein